jgi:hypothetical protein
MTRTDHASSNPLRLLLLLVALVTVVVSRATAYVLDGAKWPLPASGKATMNYVVCANTADVPNGFATLAAVVSAANTWNDAGARFQFVFAEPLCNSNPRRDGVNQIGWIPADIYPAATYVWKSGTTILESDTTINDQYKWSVATPTPFDSVDIQTVVLHELGHALGLDHSSPPAVTQPYVDYGEQRRVLTQDDKDGIIAIYGCG